MRLLASLALAIQVDNHGGYRCGFGRTFFEDTADGRGNQILHISDIQA